ncbi:unnamed protein product, partial [Pelagomonas calceolata]
EACTLRRLDHACTRLRRPARSAGEAPGAARDRSLRLLARPCTGAARLRGAVRLQDGALRRVGLRPAGPAGRLPRRADGGPARHDRGGRGAGGAGGRGEGGRAEGADGAGARVAARRRAAAADGGERREERAPGRAADVPKQPERRVWAVLAVRPRRQERRQVRAGPGRRVRGPQETEEGREAEVPRRRRREALRGARGRRRRVERPRQRGELWRRRGGLSCKHR